MEGEWRLPMATRLTMLGSIGVAFGHNDAELPCDDERRGTPQSAAFLQASLFTSILAFGVAAMALALGVLFVLIGPGIRDVSQRTSEPTR